MKTEEMISIMKTYIHVELSGRGDKNEKAEVVGFEDAAKAISTLAERGECREVPIL